MNISPLMLLIFLAVCLLPAGCKPKDSKAETEAEPAAPTQQETSPASASSVQTQPDGLTPKEHVQQAMTVLRTENIDISLDKIQTALNVVGFPEAIVYSMESEQLMVAFKLKTDYLSREMITKTSMILSAVANFKTVGEVWVVGFKYTQPMLAIQGNLTQTIQAEQGDLPWLDYLASLKVKSFTETSRQGLLQEFLTPTSKD